MEKWFIKNKKGDFSKIARAFGVSEKLVQLAVNRNVKSASELKEYLYPDTHMLLEPNKMKDSVLAVDILKKKIEQRKSIRIIGDYDVDGVMAAYLLKVGLSRVGAVVDYEIPDRIKDGYGINIDIVEAASSDNIDTIITCDNGIAAYDQIQRAKELGMTVIITDHHEVPYEEQEDGKRIYKVPPADAVVNPKQWDCSYLFKKLCGAAVVFKLLELLWKEYFIALNELEELLPFVAIATVCDVMDLEGENRVLVSQGLKKLPFSKNYGIQALIEVNQLKERKLSAYHMGFILGPCINASGRLESAKISLKMFLAEDYERAMQSAKKLKLLNEERKELTSLGVKQAYSVVEEQYESDSVLVVFLPDCHESIAGIIAGRVREKYNKPAIILTRAEQGVKGSGRSIEAYSMFEKLNECRELLTKFGGHPMAAGLSLPEENISLLRAKLNQNSSLTEDDLIRKVSFDMELPFNEISPKFIREMELLEPFGKGNGKPTFVLRNVEIINGRLIGKDNSMLRLSVKTKSSSNLYSAMLFQGLDRFEEIVGEKYGKNAMEQILKGNAKNILLDLVFYPDVNEYNGKETVQIIIQHFR
ncbi:single-stranded-DNA-specific exonuclease RecJ [Anaeromicropila populeti]|uniref:Single-stranded-DNA-specific exonuclease RecJ n=1 Tax=Anaeromicropila populeti TaxID=37658 RepID=A0A1I6IQU2_9FIRM|nr:single-stranded-DNA-specific exonuclease RecJ [Anaeromicropila populeti]SFR69078.1 single-stranded-DNA-specific exonuclease [Anaeromicropila populeti]